MNLNRCRLYIDNDHSKTHLGDFTISSRESELIRRNFFLEQKAEIELNLNSAEKIEKIIRRSWNRTQLPALYDIRVTHMGDFCHLITIDTEPLQQEDILKVVDDIDVSDHPRQRWHKGLLTEEPGRSDVIYVVCYKTYKGFTRFAPKEYELLVGLDYSVEFEDFNEFAHLVQNQSYLQSPMILNGKVGVGTGEIFQEIILQEHQIVLALTHTNHIVKNYGSLTEKVSRGDLKGTLKLETI